MPNPNTPVIVGVSQVLQRITDPLDAKEPIQLMIDAVRGAAEDAGNPKLLSDVESVRVIRGIWKYRNPARYIAEHLGMGEVETVGTPFGGNMVQKVVNQSAKEILAGSKSLIVVTGGEIGSSLARAKKAGIQLPFTSIDGTYTKMAAEEKPMAADAEMNRGIRAAIQVYPIFENAIRQAIID